MNEKDTRAFPTGQDRYGGMTLRDYFAGQALAGLSQNRNTKLATDVGNAYKMADLMLKEREEGNENS